jgi:hypothetical protein
MQYVPKENAMLLSSHLISSHLLVPLDALDLDLSLVLRSELSLPEKKLVCIQAKSIRITHWH